MSKTKIVVISLITGCLPILTEFCKYLSNYYFENKNINFKLKANKPILKQIGNVNDKNIIYMRNTIINNKVVLEYKIHHFPSYIDNGFNNIYNNIYNIQNLTKLPKNFIFKDLINVFDIENNSTSYIIKEQDFYTYCNAYIFNGPLYLYGCRDLVNDNILYTVISNDKNLISTYLYSSDSFKKYKLITYVNIGIIGFLMGVALSK